MAKDTRSKKVDLSINGFIQPHNKDLEKYVIGYMLINGTKVSEVMETLVPNDFYVQANVIIYQAIIDVSKITTPDLMMVAQKLMERGEVDAIGGIFYLTTCTNEVISDTHIKPYCISIKDMSIKRQLYKLSMETSSEVIVGGSDALELLYSLEGKLKEVNKTVNDLKVVSNNEVGLSVVKDFEDSVYKAQNNIVDENAVYTHIPEWDAINGKLFPGLYVVAGRPGMGKGVHMTQLAINMGKRYNVGIVNGEMTNEQLFRRLATNLKGLDNFVFKKNPKFVTDEEREILREGIEEALQLKLHIEDSRFISKIEPKMKSWVRNYGVKVILADFLTLFKCPPEITKYMSPTDQTNYILNSFVDTAKSEKVPIILYAQMNREILGRHGVKEPNLADLKQSGSIEELAFQVSFLHRPEYYDETAVMDELGESTKGLMHQIIAKHRDGSLGRIKLRADLTCSKISSWETNKYIDFDKQKDLHF